MLRTIYAYFRLILYLLYIEPRYWVIKKMVNSENIEQKDKLLLKTCQGISNCVLNSLKISIEVEGKENIPEHGVSYILTPNHSSLLDIPIIFCALGRVVGFVSKKENKNIPFIGRWISLFYSVYIDRTSPRNAVKSLNEGVKIIKAGHSQVIFPEGTRTKDGNLLEFKAGSYKLAKKSDSLVIPVAIIGTFSLAKKGSFVVNSGRVRVKFFEALDSELDTFEMAETSQKIISQEIKKGV